MADLNKNQRDAVSTLDRHVSVTAGPGSGKTLVLVERYLEILRSRDVSVDQIVAITFTNRAANEMRERLRRRLDQLAMDSPDSERPRWIRHKRRLDGAVITTIHGFCARLLREFPVEAGVDPQFALLDEHQTAMLEEAVVEEALTEFINADHDAITRLTLGFTRALVVDAVIQLYRAIRNQGLTFTEAGLLSEQSHATIELYQSAISELHGNIKNFLSSRGFSKSAEAKRAEVARLWPEVRELLASVSPESSLVDYCRGVRDFRERARPNAQGLIKEQVQLLDELIWSNKPFGKVPRLCFDLYSIDYVRQLVAVLQTVDRRLAEEKRNLSALDFDDLQTLALKLVTTRPEVIRRTANRYRFFLVDEFQDTNPLQRDILERLSLVSRPRPNLFVVGDRKQSIYGFRGADVDVFRQMSERIESEGGITVELNLNYRSRPELISFFNFFFEKVFSVRDGESRQLDELGYVGYELGVAGREPQGSEPAVEVLVDFKHENSADERSTRERDAEQLARRIRGLLEDPSGLGDGNPVRAGDIALLFRAMTEVYIYEARFRREGIPYLTVQGKGFYDREEITDLIQLLRFLDNKTDQLALAAMLRSPLCGLSDEALLALRRGPLVGEAEELLRGYRLRPLLAALDQHEKIDHLNTEDRFAIEHARTFLRGLIDRSKRGGLVDLLRYAVDVSEYRTVAAANYDGAQRLANIDKLFELAHRFERSGAHLIRDFVRFVREFEEAKGRESEGQIDQAADAVKLMSVHQSKGLEFPVVILPDLNRKSDSLSDWYVMDRHLGVSLKVPDGRGGRLKGEAFETAAKRAKLRETFESMRLFYVAATRAKDLLILSGATSDLTKLVAEDSWLGWTWSALQPGESVESRIITPVADSRVQLTFNLADTPQELPLAREARVTLQGPIDTISDVASQFGLLEAVSGSGGNSIPDRFGVTQLVNYQRCPRQYFFERMVYAPNVEEMAVWSDAEAPEPPANLTATFRGAVIHRFCEQYREGSSLDEILRSSFEEVLHLRRAEIGDRIAEIDANRALQELRPFAENYLSSGVRERIESARAEHSSSADVFEITSNPALPALQPVPGVYSEQRFRLKLPRGVITGTIDKLLVTGRPGDNLTAEIIDFKTNRFNLRVDPPQPEPMSTANRKTKRSDDPRSQLAFDFDPEPELSLDTEVASSITDYQLQMQAYALAVHRLTSGIDQLKVTLHFLDPNLEVSLPEQLLREDACIAAVEETIETLTDRDAPGDFPPAPAAHCQSCRYLELCPPGRAWLSGTTSPAADHEAHK